MQGLKARGNVEDWLGKVEEGMFSSLRRLLKAAITDFERKPREEWVLCHASQIILTVSQIMWCRDITEVLETEGAAVEGMKGFEQKSFKVTLVLYGKIYETISWNLLFSWIESLKWSRYSMGINN